MSANATVPGATGGPTFAEDSVLLYWGVSGLQGYMYFTRYNDKLWVRAVAATMLILDFVSVALICQSMYYYMLPHFGSFAPLSAVTKELSIECLIAAVITFISQMYFAYQLYMVKSPGITAAVMNSLVILFGIIGLGGAVGCVGMMFLYPHSIFMNRNHVFAILAGIAKGFGAAADIVATIAMCMFLKSAETGMKRTSGMLKSLMHLVINRGILVTVAQILLLITFFATAGHLYWLAVHINTTKLYVNTFFGMLNARTSLQERFATGHMSMSGETTVNTLRLAAPMSPKREKMGELDTQDYAMSAIRVTTSSTVADI
ncbi:hypothetical protein MSAN_01144500 [Mycena sanguinolenta]|uniref:DUF6534 domain-containing protein n=1 Tax=Mycena sanguinolenta TaxID=230812 RepID=A0A8H6YL92_9AGAR|nr:hypothetical protein MSAN_01144500 [Mycena sanguinolenta]